MRGVVHRLHPPILGKSLSGGTTVGVVQIDLTRLALTADRRNKTLCSIVRYKVGAHDASASSELNAVRGGADNSTSLDTSALWS